MSSGRLSSKQKLVEKISRLFEEFGIWVVTGFHEFEDDKEFESALIIDDKGGWFPEDKQSLTYGKQVIEKVMVLLKAILFDLGDKFVPERGKAKTLPYALEVLTDLNLSLSLLLFGNATTVTLERVKEIMKNAEILDFLDAIIVSTDVDHSKPDERIFQIALEKLGVETTGSNNGGQSHLNRHPRWE